MRIPFLLLTLLFAVGSAKATHLYSGHISLKLKSGLTYTVTLKIFTNTTSEIRFGDGILDFGDGSPTIKTPIIENTLTPYNNVGVVSFSVLHEFPKDGTYVISYGEPNLNEGIANVNNSVETPFYLESGVSLISGRDSSSPEFLVNQFFEQSAGSKFSFSNQAVDQNDYRLTYSLAIPLAPSLLLTPLGHGKYSQPDGFSINYYNGLVNWAPNLQGQYLFAVRVDQFDKFGSRVGFVTRTILVRSADTGFNLATTTTAVDVNRKVFVDVNKQKTIRAIASDNALSTEVRWEAFFEDLIAGNVVLSYYDSTAGSNRMKVAVVTLTSTPEVVRDNPYSITLRGLSTSALGTVYANDISYLFFTKDIELPVIITGVNDEPSRRSSAYPNPFSHHLYVDCQSTTDEFDYKLMDITGKVMIEEKGVTSNKSIEASHLSAGMYILQIGTGFVTELHKLIKQ